jgi:hypothetical protein
MVTDQLNGGKTSGSQSGSSTNINDAVLRQIIEEFKNNAKTRTWEEYKAEMISKGYTVDVEFTHQFTAQLADGRTANVVVSGSAKEMYENFRQQALNAEKLASEQNIQKQNDTINWTNTLADKELNRRNEWNDFTSIDKQQSNTNTSTKLADQIIGRNDNERKNAIEQEKRKLEEAKKKAEYDLWWNSLTPEQKTEYIAAQNAEKIRQQQEEAARKQKELEQYMNQYNLDWKAEFNDKTATETPKTDTPSIPPITPSSPTISLTPPITTIPIMPNTSTIRVIPSIPTQIVDTSGLTEVVSAGNGIVNGSIANIPAQPSVQTPLFYVETPEEDSLEELVQPEAPAAEAPAPIVNQPAPEELPNVKKPVYYYPGMW